MRDDMGFCAGSGYTHYDAHDGGCHFGGVDVETMVNCYGNHTYRGSAQYAGGYFWRPQLSDADCYAEFRAVYAGAVGKRRTPLLLSVRERYFSTKRSSISVSCKRGVPGGRLTSTAPPEAGMRAVMLRALRRTVTFTSPNVGCVSVRELSIFPSEARCRVNMRLSRNPTEVWCGWC